MTDSQTLKNILETVKVIKDNAVTKKEFGELTKEFDELSESVGFIKDNAVTKKEFDELNTKVTQMQSEMVTRDYLDKKFLKYADKITESSSDANTKLVTLVNTLHGKKALTNEEQKKILALKPFAQLSL